MKQTLLDALQYIENNNGRAMLANFLEDHEPIGPSIWHELNDHSLVYIDSGQMIRLTRSGEAALLSRSVASSARPIAAAGPANTDSNSLDLTNPLNPINPLSPLNVSYETETHRSDHCSISHSSDSSGGYVSSSSSNDSCSSSDSSSSSDY